MVRLIKHDRQFKRQVLTNLQLLSNDALVLIIPAFIAVILTVRGKIIASVRIESTFTFLCFTLHCSVLSVRMKDGGIQKEPVAEDEPQALVCEIGARKQRWVDCQHFFRQIFLGYFPDIVQAFDTLGRNVYGDDYTSLHNPIVLSSVLLVYGMFHSTRILF